MSRIEKIFEILRLPIEDKIKIKTLEINNKIEEEKDNIKIKFLEKIELLLKKVSNDNKKVRYILISPLNSSIITESYEVQIAIYTNEFYFQKEEYIDYYKIPLIFDNIEEEMKEIEKIIEKNFTKVEKYEIKEAKYNYIKEHNILIMIFINYFIKYIEELNILKEVKEDKLDILYGEYMERNISLLKI